MALLEDLFYEKKLPVDVHFKNLPHWEQPNKLQFITFRLEDSLPQKTIENLRIIKELWLREHNGKLNKKALNDLRTLISAKQESLLDNGYGSCTLSRKDVADIVENVLLYSDGLKYKLHLYVIMSNHVHVLLEVYENIKLSNVIRSWKSVSAVQINKLLGKEGKYWQDDYFDRMIRDEPHYHNTINYIYDNYISSHQRARLGGFIYNNDDIIL